MVRLSALVSLLLSLVIPSSATSAPLAKEIEVNGVRLSYVEQGAGEPVVFVHGAFSDLRVWEPIEEEIAKKYRFIAYTQRYHGVGAWKDEGKEYSVATHADDLAKFITSLNAGAVHFVAWSYGGQVATTAAVNNPSLVRSLTLYEASAISVLPADSTEGKAAREERGKMFAPAAAASKAGDPVKATRLGIEAAFQLPPGGSDREPQAWQTMWDENSRTTVPSTAPVGHHVRHAEDLHSADADPGMGENGNILRVGQRCVEQVHPCGSPSRASEREP